MNAFPILSPHRALQSMHLAGSSCQFMVELGSWFATSQWCFSVSLDGDDLDYSSPVFTIETSLNSFSCSTSPVKIAAPHDSVLKETNIQHGQVTQQLRCGEGRHFDLGMSHSWDLSQH